MYPLVVSAFLVSLESYKHRIAQMCDTNINDCIRILTLLGQHKSQPKLPQQVLKGLLWGKVTNVPLPQGGLQKLEFWLLFPEPREAAPCREL